MADERAKEALGGKKSKKDKKKHKRHIHIRHAANGGYIAKHEFEPMEDMEGEGVPSPEEHVIPGDLEMLGNHVKQHMALPEKQQEQMPIPDEQAQV